MKTQVEVKQDIYQEQAKKGDRGYIDGYIRGANERLYAVVVIKDFISLIPFLVSIGIFSLQDLSL